MNELIEELQVMLWYYETFRDPREPVGDTEREDTDRIRRLLIKAKADGLLRNDALTTTKTRELVAIDTTHIRFALLGIDGHRGPEKSITLENPDPHPEALRRLAADWAKTQKQRAWKQCYIISNPGTISSKTLVLPLEET